MQWQVTTQPNFVTKLKPTQSEKLPSQIKPKPTKKPIISTVPDLVKKPTLPSTTISSKPSSNTLKPSQVCIFYFNVQSSCGILIHDVNIHFFDKKKPFWAKNTYKKHYASIFKILA